MHGYVKQNIRVRMRPQLSWEEIEGTPFLVLSCGQIDSRRRYRQLRRALACMTEQGVCKAVMPTELKSLCCEMGIQAISEKTLRLALLEPLLDRFCTQNGLNIRHSTVRLCAHRTDRTVQKAAVLLTERARYVELQMERGREELGDWLRREYGLSVGNGGHRAMMQISCDAAQGENIPTLWLGEECEKHQRIHYCVRAPWHGQIEENPQLLSVLFDEGKLPIDAIEVKSVESYA